MNDSRQVVGIAICIFHPYHGLQSIGSDISGPWGFTVGHPVEGGADLGGRGELGKLSKFSMLRNERQCRGMVMLEALLKGPHCLPRLYRICLILHTALGNCAQGVGLCFSPYRGGLGL
eukprot:15333277-Ditylum_brightwellii.AAC.1